MVCAECGDEAGDAGAGGGEGEGAFEASHFRLHVLIIDNAY